MSKAPWQLGLPAGLYVLPQYMGNCSLPSLGLPQCLLENPQVFAISSCCPLVIVDGLSPVRFVVVLCFSVWHPPFKSAVTLLGHAGLPGVIYTLFLRHSML